MDQRFADLFMLIMALVHMMSNVEPTAYEGSEFAPLDRTASRSTPGQPHGAIGHAFYIPKEDLLSTELTSRGATFFDQLPSKCIVENKVAIDRKDESFYSSTKDLYSTISTDTNIDLSLQGEFTMGASIRAVTNNLVSSHTQVSGNSLELFTQTIEASITQDCINTKPLHKTFLDDFKKLPKTVAKPWMQSSWRDYQMFLKKYGSHVVDTVLSGASIYQYAFARSDSSYSQRNFTVKACASLAGPTEVGELDVSACSGVTKNDIKAVSKLKMIGKLVIRGGRAETRAKLMNSRDKPTIVKFLVEGKTNPSPIMYRFSPIWDILEARFIGTKLMAQARNLEEFYKGFLDYGCPYQKTTNGQVLQKFVPSQYSTPDVPAYQCMIGPKGCHDHNDCHYRFGVWCACGGPSCIGWKDVQLNNGEKKTIAYAHNPPYSYWSWQGCRLSRALTSCWCYAESITWKIVWRDDRQHVLANIHEAVRKRLEGGQQIIRNLKDI